MQYLDILPKWSLGDFGLLWSEDRLKHFVKTKIILEFRSVCHLGLVGIGGGGRLRVSLVNGFLGAPTPLHTVSKYQI